MRLRLRRLLYVMSGLFWSVVACMLIYWQWLDTAPIYTHESIVAESPVHRGGVLVLHSSFCQRGSIVPGTGVRSIKNEFVYVLSDTAAVIAAGCYSVHREINLPSSLVLGPHTYNFTALFQVNPIKVMAGAIRPVPFEVIP